jgi:hypothetical protein
VGVDQTILSEIKDKLYCYDCCLEDIEDYIKTSSNKLAQATPKLVAKMLKKHGKQPLLVHLEKLLDIEKRTKTLLPRHRDHVGHMFSTFLLGIFINENLLGQKVDAFQWELASLFHDVGYPLEISHTIDKEFIKTINDIRGTIGVPSDDISEQVILDNLISLQDGKNALELIQTRLNSWELPLDVSKLVKNNAVDHGIISALVILYTVDLLYHQNNTKRLNQNVERDNVNWNQDFFESDIISVCSAIFIHNLPRECFGKAKIKLKLSPLAYLLFLSDNIQEWRRPSLTNRFGYPSTSYAIQVEHNRLHIRVPNLEQKRKITEKLADYLSPFPLDITSSENS